jgi:hypothetical protein
MGNAALAEKVPGFSERTSIAKKRSTPNLTRRKHALAITAGNKAIASRVWGIMKLRATRIQEIIPAQASEIDCAIVAATRVGIRDAKTSKSMLLVITIEISRYMFPFNRPSPRMSGVDDIYRLYGIMPRLKSCRIVAEGAH